MCTIRPRRRFAKTIARLRPIPISIFFAAVTEKEFPSNHGLTFSQPRLLQPELAFYDDSNPVRT
jgi:hypothetical protein